MDKVYNILVVTGNDEFKFSRVKVFCGAYGLSVLDSDDNTVAIFAPGIWERVELEACNE